MRESRHVNAPWPLVVFLVVLLVLSTGPSRAADPPEQAPAPQAPAAESGAAQAPAEPADDTPLPPATKVLVIARVQDPNRRGVVEEMFRAEFAKLGLEVLTSLGHMTEDDFASPDALKAKVKALGVDGVFGLGVEYVDASVGGSASVSVGVATTGYGGGRYGNYYGAYGGAAYGYGYYVGASKPIGDAKVTARTTVRLMFYNRPGAPAWQKVEKNTFEADNLDTTAAKVAKKAVKELHKKKLVAGS